jgi:hypothetical protein
MEVSNQYDMESDIETTTALAKTFYTPLRQSLKPYDMESDIETATALAKTMEVSNHTIWNPI